MQYITIATEDSLSEALLRRILSVFAPRLMVANAIGQKGNGHLRKRLPNLLTASQNGMPVVLLTDSDGPRDASIVRDEWLAGITFDSERFYLAVAVQEAEAWFLADNVAVESLLKRRPRAIPTPTDSLQDPKEWLLHEARRSARQIRQQLIREERGAIRIGAGYNSMISKVVIEEWSPQRARENSSSLDRLMTDLLSW